MHRPAHPNNNRRRAAGGAALVAAACVVAAVVVPGAGASPSVRGAGGQLRRRRQQRGECADPERQCVSRETGRCENRVNCLLDPCEMNPCADGEECAANYCGGCHPVCTVAPQEESVPVILSEPFPTGGCARGQCPHPKTGQCMAIASCLAGPCRADSCADGQVCTANYCGGCHPVCLPEEPDVVSDPFIPSPVESDPISCAIAVGGRDPEPCPAGAFCKLAAGDCLTDAVGECFFTSPDMACLMIHDPICGCDGNTYSNDCISTSAGVNVASKGPCARDDPEPVILDPSPPPYEKPRPTCAAGPPDAIAGLDVDVERCPANTFCKLPPGDCVTKISPHIGECSKQSAICPMVEDPVCGCDGETYSCECVADYAGVSITHRGPCDEDKPAKPPVEEPVPEVEDPPTEEDEEAGDACPSTPKRGCRRDRRCKWSKKMGTCYARPEQKPKKKPKKPGKETDKPKKPKGPKAQDAPLEEDMSEKYWPTGAHEATSNGVHECVKSSDYPPTFVYAQEKLGIKMLFDSYEECCSAFPCSYADAIAGSTTNPLDLPLDQLLGYWSEVVPDELLDGLGDFDPFALLAEVHCSLNMWHMSLSVMNTCTNGEADPYWADMPGSTFYGTAPECCEKEFGEFGMECHVANACPDSILSEGVPERPKTLDELLNEIDPVPLPVVDPILSEGPGPTVPPGDIPLSVEVPTDPFLSDPAATVPNIATFPVPETTEEPPLGDVPKVPPTKPAECPEGECLSHQGRCGRVADHCQIDPCAMVRCGAGTECREDNCGGCHAYCAPAASVAHDGAPKTEYWWPVKEDGGKTCVYSAEYPDHFANDGELTLVFNNREACCAAYSACETTAPAVEHWYPHTVGKYAKPSCVYGSDYPDEYMTTDHTREKFLFDGYNDCCAAFPEGCSVNAKEDVSEYWYPALVGGTTPDCVYGNGYPTEYTASNHTREAFLFGSEADCCAAYPEAKGCPGSAGADEPSTKDEYWYPANVDVHPHCVYGSDYPDSPGAIESLLGLYLFESEADCCAAHPCGADYAEKFLHVAPNAEMINLPWDFGDPPGWEADDAVSASSNNTDLLKWDAYWLGEHKNTDELSFNGHSLTNIPVAGAGAASDLTLKIYVPDKATLRCLARIDVHMPFERFVLLVNGKLRDVFIKPEKEWMPILNGFATGWYTLVFRVENGDIEVNPERVGGVGSGRVWLDQCQLIGHT